MPAGVYLTCELMNNTVTLTAGMLSEKAKGKQRAVDLASQASTSHAPASRPEESKRDFVVRFTEGGVTDLLVTIHKGEIVRDVKKKVRLFCVRAKLPLY
jgi:hypothetical protein